MTKDTSIIISLYSFGKMEFYQMFFGKIHSNNNIRSPPDSYRDSRGFLGPTGFDSGSNCNVSMSSAGIQLVNIIFHTFLNGENNYALAA